MHLLICLTESHLLPSINLSGIPTTYQNIRNDDETDKFKSIAVLHNKNSFTCLEQENYHAVLYIKFATTLSSLNQFSMLVLYRKINSNLADFVGYVTYLVITKHVDLILGDFNEDSLLNERPITTSLQSLGFTQIVSEPTRVPVLTIFISEITKTASQIFLCYLIVFIFLTMIQLFYTIKIGR